MASDAVKSLRWFCGEPGEDRYGWVPMARCEYWVCYGCDVTWKD